MRHAELSKVDLLFGRTAEPDFRPERLLLLKEWSF